MADRKSDKQEDARRRGLPAPAASDDPAAQGQLGSAGRRAPHRARRGREEPAPADAGDDDVVDD
ncbi:MAG: hypothetical protein IPO18_00010 [bacterium]|nr:hypothetical protein [bacterium]